MRPPLCEAIRGAEGGSHIVQPGPRTSGQATGPQPQSRHCLGTSVAGRGRRGVLVQIGVVLKARIDGISASRTARSRTGRAARRSARRGPRRSLDTMPRR